MNICVIGGGNIGTTLAADLSSLHPEYSIRLLTSRPSDFQTRIQINDIENERVIFGTVGIISDNPSDTVCDSDIIFITHPSFMINDTLLRIKSYVKEGAYICVIPGFGGCEYYVHQHFGNSVTLVGFQRVPYIVRMLEYGRISNLLSRKPEIVVASIPASKINDVSCLIQELMQVPCVPAPNYLSVTLTPSNPLLHTARVYDLFLNLSADSIMSRNPKFYSEWTVRASEVLFGMDAELQQLCKSISDTILSSVVSLTIHYESNTPDELVQKMRSIISLKDIESPLVCAESGFMPNIQSRYFIEDFPFGLCIIKGFCEIYHLKTPTIDKVLQWYERFSGVEYFINGKFEGKDLKDTAIPQNFGLSSPRDVVEFYGLLS